MAGDVIAELRAVIGLDDSGFSSGLNKSKSSWNEFSSEIQRSQGPVGGVSRSLGMIASPAGLAAAGVASVGVAMAAATQQAIAWESSLKNIEKTAGENTNIEALSSALLDLSTSKPVDASGLAEMAAVAGQLGIDGTENVVAFVNTITDASVAFGMVPDQAAASLAKLGNLFEGGDVTQLDNLGSAINAMGNSMAATEPQIIAAMTKMAGLGAQYGMTGSEAAALAGRLVALGMDADSAGTLTNSFMSQLTDPGKWAKAGELIGMTADEFGKLATSDIDESMLEIAEALEQIADPAERATAISDLGFSQESAKVLNKMVGHTDEIRASMELANQAYEEQTALATEAAAKYSSTASKIQLIKNDVGAIAIDLGGWVVDSEGFQNGLDTIHSTLELVRENMDVIGGTVSHLGGDLKTVFEDFTPAGWLYTGLQDEESAIGSAARGLGERVWGGIVEYSGVAGEDAGEEFTGAVDEEVSDAAPEIGESLAEEMDGEGAGKSVGEDFSKGFLDGTATLAGGFTKQAMDSMHSAGMMYNYATGGYESRSSGKHDLLEYGEVQVGDINPLTLTYKLSDGYWKLKIVNAQGEEIGTQEISASRAAGTGLMDEEIVQLLVNDFLGSSTREAAPGANTLKKNLSSTEIEALQTVDAELGVTLSGRVALTTEFEDVVGPIQKSISDLESQIQDAIDSTEYGAELDLSTMIDAGFTDFETVMEEIGEDAYSAFADGFTDKVEVKDLLDRLRVAKRTDREAFENLGGQDLLDNLSEIYKMLIQLEDVQERIAGLEAAGMTVPIELKVEEGDLQTKINDDIEAAAPYLVPLKAETVDFTWDLAKLNAAGTTLGEQLNQWGVWDTFTFTGEQFIQPLAEDLMDLTEDGIIPMNDALGESGEMYDRLADAIELVNSNKDQFNYKTVELIENFDLENATMTDFMKLAKELGATYDGIGEKARDLKAEYQDRGALETWFGYWQEAQDDMFSGAYIGPTEGWAGQGQGAKPGWESENFFSYGVELETGEAEVDLGKLRTEAETKKITPIDADISPALAQNAILEAELSEPVIKKVYIQTVGGGGFGSGGWSADGFLNSTFTPKSVSSGSLQSRYSNITWLDEGGIATQPTPSIVGERRPEAIAPLEELMPMIQTAVATVSGSGGDVTVNAPITVYGGGDARKIAEEVAAELEIRISHAHYNRFRS